MPDAKLTYLYNTVDTAEKIGLPADTIFRAVQFAAFPTSSWADVEFIEMGEDAEPKVIGLSAMGSNPRKVLVSVLGYGAAVHWRDGSVLSHNDLHLGTTDGHDRADMTAFLGVALQRPIDIKGACDCERHSNLAAARSYPSYRGEEG